MFLLIRNPPQKKPSEPSVSSMLRKPADTLTSLAAVTDGSQATKWCLLPKHTWHHWGYIYIFFPTDLKTNKNPDIFRVNKHLPSIPHRNIFLSHPQRRRSRDTADRLPTPGIAQVTMATSVLAYYRTEECATGGVLIDIRTVYKCASSGVKIVHTNGEKLYEQFVSSYMML